MYSLTFLAIAAFAISFLSTPLFRRLFLRLGWVDRPDHRRKLHHHPVPHLGGVVIVVAFCAAFALLVISPLQGGDRVERAFPMVLRIAPAALLVFFTGVLDDLFGLKPWQKLCGQLAGAGLACWAGLHIRIYGYRFETWWYVPLTMLWLVACTNAFNLIDGLDGLATGVGLFATLTTLVAALIHNNHELALATAPLAGALLGFLRYNFNPASIFLGDSGSLTVGFLLGCYSVLWSHKSATMLGLTAPLMALSVPLLDTGVSIVRRALRGKPIFGGDRGHVHHRLLERGLTPRRVALILYGVCGLGAAFSLLLTVSSNRAAGVIIVLFGAAAWIGIQHLGYMEFGLAGRLIMPGNLTRVVHARMRLAAFEQAIAAAASVEDCWKAVAATAGEFGFAAVRFQLNGWRYEEYFTGLAAAAYWTIDIPLSCGGHVAMSRGPGRELQPAIAAPFADCLRRSLDPKLVSLLGPPEMVSAVGVR